MTEQADLFENEKLVAPIRRPDARPADMPEAPSCDPGQPKKRRDQFHSSALPLRAHVAGPFMIRKRLRIRRGEAAKFKAQVEALIECYKPGKIRTTKRVRRWKR